MILAMTTFFFATAEKPGLPGVFYVVAAIVGIYLGIKERMK